MVLPPAFAALLNLAILCHAFYEVGACFDREREALNAFRNALIDPHRVLSSWYQDADCCKWKGVSCDKHTGYVTKIELPADGVESRLSGPIDPALLQLNHLHFLDLRFHDFGGSTIPSFLGSMKELRHLDLSFAKLGGRIPHQLGNLSKLVFLDLSFNRNLSSENIWWLTNMSSLEYLDMSFVNLSLARCHWADVVMNGCLSLVELHLSSCSLSCTNPSLSFVNTTSLQVLNIEDNNFDSPIPKWISNISSLISLSLSFNKFHGQVPYQMSQLPSLEELSMGDRNDDLAPDWSVFSEGCWNKLKELDLILSHGSIPESIGNISSLVSLSLMVDGATIPDGLGRLKRLELLVFNHLLRPLSGPIPASLGGLSSLKSLLLANNQLNGTIPETLGGLSSLQALDLRENQLTGNIPTALGQLSSLIRLDVSSNFLSGTVSAAHFENLRDLKELTLSANPLAMDLQPDWIPPFQLHVLHLRSVNTGPRFPLWLHTQRMIEALDISNASISDAIPTSFWHSRTTIKYLNLSHNMLSGQLPYNLEMKNLSLLDLRWNILTGSIPRISSPFLSLLDFSNNQFSGSIPTNISFPSVFFSCASNRISGSIPPSICKMSEMLYLDLSSNSLSGTIPATMGNCTHLIALDFSGNHLCGRIPASLGSLVSLETLHLSGNGLYGKLPSSLKNCSNFVTLDLGDNKFSGKIPPWIGESFVGLRNLRLRGNLFAGGIPLQLFNLTFLQVFDAAYNCLSGPIPSAFEDLKAMKNGTHESLDYVGHFGPVYSFDALSYGEHLDITTKGISLTYTKTIPLLTCIDLSSNNFSGEIPDALTTLSGLNVLNLSGNHLIGKIPNNIGGLAILESLDLSRNELSGIIPQSISRLYFLSFLNLSNNNLSGRIPSGKQLQALPYPSIYFGNAGLCGFPLSECGGDKRSGGEDGKGDPADQTDHLDETDPVLTFWFYVGIAPGFVVGFWTICGILILKKNWRVAYFQLVDDLTDKLNVLVIICMARLKEKVADKKEISMQRV